MPSPKDDNFDKLYKVRPLIAEIQKSLTMVPQEEYNCVDEQIIPFKGRHTLKQYVKNKQHNWGFKIFTRTGESGLMYNFKIIKHSSS